MTVVSIPVDVTPGVRTHISFSHDVPRGPSSECAEGFHDYCGGCFCTCHAGGGE